MVTSTRETRPRRRTSILLWAGQILMALFFVALAAEPKLTSSHDSVHEFALIGAGQWFRYFVGTLEVIGAIGLLIPRLAGLAAAWLACVMVGATITNATVLRNTSFANEVWLTLILLVITGLLAYGRRQQIKGLAAAVRARRRLATDSA
jgi:uncharacterized membrane protein YphA (DoxX/SURF4 family)